MGSVHRWDREYGHSWSPINGWRSGRKILRWYHRLLNIIFLRMPRLSFSCIITVFISVSPKTLFWACKVARKYKVTYHARNTLAKHGRSTLRFCPTQTPKVSDTYNYNFYTLELFYNAHRMSIRKRLTKQTV